MRSAELNQNNIVINYAEVSSFGYPYLDPLNSVLGAFWNGVSFENPQPPEPEPPPYDPYDEYKAMIYRRADSLESAGDIVGALLLRESLK